MENLNKEASTSSGSADTKGLNKKYEETSFGGETSGDEMASLIEKEKNVDAAWKKIDEKFPNRKTYVPPFTARINEFGVIEVRLNRSNRKYRSLFNKYGKLNEKLPKEIKDYLGSQAEVIVENNEEIARRNKKISELQDQIEKTSDEHIRDNLNQTIAEEQDAIAQLERANEEIEQRMTLRDRVRAIFKKYGFTVLAVASAVGVVIGVIVANLKNGLTSLGKGVGNGLKTIGKKLGEILPGLVGAIASFVFKTAGEVVGFLAKNAWLLIVGIVIYLVEQFKK